MRLGGPLFETWSTPQQWATLVAASGYSAAFCPVGEDADEETVAAYAEAAAEADVSIAEVGAWQNNPISPDDAVRRAGIEGCCRSLELADRIGARCCVNVSGSRGEIWDGAHRENLRAETFDLVVASVREIIDTVRPTRSCYTLETMPWMLPDSPQVYLDLVRAVDREHFGVHLDPVNLVSSPRRYFDSGALLRECFELLGPSIRSCHAKDVILRDELTLHLDEVRPGAGELDWHTYARELGRLDRDVPLMLEHLSDPEQYRAGASFIRSVAKAEGVVVV